MRVPSVVGAKVTAADSHGVVPGPSDMMNASKPPRTARSQLKHEVNRSVHAPGVLSSTAKKKLKTWLISAVMSFSAFPNVSGSTVACSVAT